MHYLPAQQQGLNMAGGKGGRPQKRKRNITGLRNQCQPQQETTLTSDNGKETQETEESIVSPISNTSENPNKILDDCWVPEDHIRTASYFGYGEDEDSEDEDEDLLPLDWDNEVFAQEDLQEAMFHYAAAMDNDIKDKDWVPDYLQQRKKH